MSAMGAVVVVVYVADFVGHAVAVLVDVITPAWALGLSNLDALQAVGAVVTRGVEVTILVVEATDTLAQVLIRSPALPATQRHTVGAHSVTAHTVTTWVCVPAMGIDEATVGSDDAHSAGVLCVEAEDIVGVHVGTRNT